MKTNCSSKYVIYIIICSCNNHYIGQTINSLSTRLNTHRYQNKTEKHAILKFNQHILHTKHDFKITILHETYTHNKLELNYAENFFIHYLKPFFNS